MRKEEVLLCQCRFGAFDELILDKDDAPKLQNLIKYLNKTK